MANAYVQRRRSSKRTVPTQGGAYGTSYDDHPFNASPERETVTPVLIRKRPAKDFEIFARQVSDRRNPNNRRKPQNSPSNVITPKPREPDPTKVVAASQPLTPMSEDRRHQAPTKKNSPVIFVNEEEVSVNNGDQTAAHGEISFVDTSTEPLMYKTPDNSSEAPSSESITENLPPFTVINKVPNTMYNNKPPEEFARTIDNIYEEMVTWRKNLFLVPTGKVGKTYIKLTSEWLQNFNSGSTFQGIAMKVVMILPNLLLQKPSASSKSKEHTKILENRLSFWNEGKISELFRDCKIIQKKLKNGKKRTEEDVTRIFSKLVLEGKIGAALKFLDENVENGVLKPNEAVINKLKSQHPNPTEILPDTLLHGPLIDLSPTTFSCIDEQYILKAANQVKGSGGPSLLDAKQWRRMLCSKHYKGEGKVLREEVAHFARKVATEILDPSTLESYTACRLLPLDKAPGEEELQVRPIGVGEVLRRIVGKTISWALNDEIQEAGGSLQVSSGLKGGAEAAIHAMKEIFDLESTEAVILVDAENAFNRLNRRVALHNIQYMCPNFATVLINTYRRPSRLFITGGGEIASSEGTTQGDSLAMQFYGISTTPLIYNQSHEQTKLSQVWLADDATGAGTLPNLKNWWDYIQEQGKKYGYHVKPSKSWLILKDPNKLPDAQNMFKDSPINITTSGKRHLGAAIGSSEYKDSYFGEKVTEWCNRLKSLSQIAKSQPQAAYAAYIHGEQHRYTYFLRTLPNITDILKPLDNIISNEFIPALFGCNISPNEREILAMPIKDGGLGIRVPSENAENSYNASLKITSPLKENIIKQTNTLPLKDQVKNARTEALANLNNLAREKTNAVCEKQTTEMKRTLEQLAEPGASSWLGAIPLKDQGFNLNKGEFQDAMCLRYDKPLKNLPSKCPCGQNFTVCHAMNCHRGGFVNVRHNNIRNFESRLLKEVCNDVQIEPPLQPVSGATFHRSAIVTDDARLDIRARGFWRDGQNAYFDVRTTNADNASQKNKTLKAVLRSHEMEKKRQYNARVMEVEQGTFTPLVITVKGVMGPECNRFHKTLAEKIANKTGERYDEVTRLIRIKVSFLVLKAALLCLRGSRSLNSNIEVCDDFAFTLNELNLH